MLGRRAMVTGLRGAQKAVVLFCSERSMLPKAVSRGYPAAAEALSSFFDSRPGALPTDGCSTDLGCSSKSVERPKPSSQWGDDTEIPAHQFCWDTVGALAGAEFEIEAFNVKFCH